MKSNYITILCLILVMLTPNIMIYSTIYAVNYSENNIDINGKKLTINSGIYKWSPDSQSIAINTKTGFYIINLNNENKKIKSNGFSVDYKWANDNIIIISTGESFEIVTINNIQSKKYNLMINNKKNISNILDFDYDSNNNRIVFTCREINYYRTKDLSPYQVFVLNLDNECITKLIDDKEYDIFNVFFNKSGDKLFFLQESFYSKFYDQLNVYDFNTLEIITIAEMIKIEQINENMAFGKKLILHQSPNQISYEDIILDMNNIKIKSYEYENIINVSGYNVPVDKGYLEYKDLLILLSPDKEKALFVNEEGAKILFLKE